MFFTINTLKVGAFEGINKGLVIGSEYQKYKEEVGGG